MADACAKATNVAVRTAIQTGATADGTAITLPWDGAEMAGFIARASDSIYTNTLKFATGVIVSPTQWSNIMGMVDSSNRPLFIASQPMNAAGSVSQSLRGSLLRRKSFTTLRPSSLTRHGRIRLAPIVQDSPLLPRIVTGKQIGRAHV